MLEIVSPKESFKEGKEWFADTLPEAFEEAKELIEKAKERKGYNQVMDIILVNENDEIADQIFEKNL